MFHNINSFETADIFTFYRQKEPYISPNTVNWRIYSLVQMGVLNRIGRGKFMLGNQQNYFPEISRKIKLLNSKIKKEFPFIKLCIWDTSILNEFMHHQPGHFYVMLEVEKDSSESIFYFLKDLNYAVFLEPNDEILDKYLPENKDIFIIKSLVTEAPLLNVKGVNTISIEKMLVDIFCDNVTFSFQQGAELRTIFQNAVSKYTINQSRMFRYADRKGKKVNFINYWNSISNYRQ